jgi:RNA polymerase sigma-70 factor (ECF subfamily)
MTELRTGRCQTRRRGEHVLVRAPRRLDPDRAVEHLPRLYPAARAWTDSREEAEDLVQETYVRVFARPRFLRREDELGYLLMAMRNTLISQRRAQSRRPQTAPLLEDLALGARESDDPAEAAESRQVLAAIHELPEEFRDALVAVDVVGLSYREAAQALGVPEGTVTSRLFRARDRVADSLEGSSSDQQSRFCVDREGSVRPSRKRTVFVGVTFPNPSGHGRACRR